VTDTEGRDRVGGGSQFGQFMSRDKKGRCWADGKDNEERQRDIMDSM
jgi:hypothetical protein